MNIVRKSKFRHVFGGLAKRQATYEGLNPTQNTLDSGMLKVNQKFVAYIYQSSGGGIVSVFPITQTGRHPNEMPLIKGIPGPVTDLDFSPSNPNILATGSDDSVIRIWTIPEDGLVGDLHTPSQVLKGHGRKPTELLWNPTAGNILGSSGLEPTIRAWDVVKEKNVFTIEGKHEDVIQSFQWNETGNLIATQCRDKKARVFDIRSGKTSYEIASHPGVKSARINWSNEKNWLISPGFGKGDREILVWDLKNPSHPIVQHNIDTSSGAIQSFFDEGTQLLFIATKGETGIRYYELNNDPPFSHFIANFTEGTPLRGICMLPYIFLHTRTCEIARFYKLTSKNTIEPVTFTVPRRADGFQQDLYPDRPDLTAPALTADEWVAGQNKEQKKHVFVADVHGDEFDTPNPASSPPIPSHFPMPKSPEPAAPAPVYEYKPPQPETPFFSYTLRIVELEKAITKLEKENPKYAKNAQERIQELKGLIKEQDAELAKIQAQIDAQKT